MEMVVAEGGSRVVGGGGHEVACDRAAGGVGDWLAGVEG